MEQLQILIIVIGIVIVLVGVLWNVIPFGRLPGDVKVENENFSFYFPIVTCIIISIVLTVAFLLINYFRM